MTIALISKAFFYWLQKHMLLIKNYMFYFPFILEFFGFNYNN